MVWVWRLRTKKRVAPHLTSGALVRVLEDWCPRRSLVSSSTIRVNGSYDRHSPRLIDTLRFRAEKKMTPG